MPTDILKQIVEKRLKDIEHLGLTFGKNIPKERRKEHIEFLGSPGAILEIKRASPSKGDIAPNLNPIELANNYANANANAISVLTESNYFKGSLDDLILVSDEMQKRIKAKAHACAILRKDFLLFEDEIDIAYFCGADAVLLIARILDDEQLLKMALRAQKLNMQAFVEIRESDDVRKLNMLQNSLKDFQKTIVAGVNSRDLATFCIDPLVPAAMRNFLPQKAVFESGVKNSNDASYARSLDFNGILVGEAVAKNPSLAKEIVNSFTNSTENIRGKFWKTFVERKQKKLQNSKLPMVKICGITNETDGIFAAKNGADLLGFVFSNTKRLVNESFVRAFKKKLYEQVDLKEYPLLIGVITDINSSEGRLAIKLAKETVLDAIQFHGIYPKYFDENENDFACFGAVRVKEKSDLKDVETLIKNGEPRVLLDAKVDGVLGGSGTRVPEDLLHMVQIPLWLAGGITPENVTEICKKFKPELIDVSSGVEQMPGKKDLQKIKSLFENLQKI